MKKHLSLPAVLIASLALFLSLSGTAVAAILVSSNGQVAPHVIAGAAAPSGDNRNLISGSVGSSDLHASAVTGTAVKNGSLTGSDLAKGSIGYGKLTLPMISWSGVNTDPIDFAPHHTALSLDGVTLGVSCLADTGQSVLELWLTSPSAGTLRGSYALGSDGSSNNPVSIIDRSLPASTPVNVVGVENTTLVGQLTYSNANRVIAISLDGGTVNGVPGSGSCNLHGTALPTPN
ncbi:MAG TPA: hypothetical protein VFM09_03380 [Marmoricola sp.]|nr:hypothetical protein [Marmoricola sp.]